MTDPHALSAPGEVRELFPSEDLSPSDDLFPGSAWRWRSLSETDRYGRDELYRSHVAHEELHQPLDTAIRFFNELATEAGPPGGRR